MAINPTSPNGPSPKLDPTALESARTAETRKAGEAAAAKAAKAPQNSKGDSVDVSAEAKALAQQSEARAASSIAPDRLKQIGERLASGFYDQPEVVDQVARRVAKDPDLFARS
jgi:anti-sigma28 factor (negative regulator of flagellin synthesis)